MGPKLWMRNLTGNAREIPFSSVEKLKEQGWVVIESKDLDVKGMPKQMYHPSYDKNNPGRERRVIAQDDKINKDVLVVENF